jgi:hypothetical protein
LDFFHWNIFIFFYCRYAKFVDLEKNILTTEEDELIQKVLTNKTTKRKRSIDDEDESISTGITTEQETEIIPIDENDMKWAANYVEEQQTQLILSLLDDPGPTSTNDDEEQNKEDDYKSLRPSLETMGIGKSFTHI